MMKEEMHTNESTMENEPTLWCTGKKRQQKSVVSVIFIMTKKQRRKSLANETVQTDYDKRKRLNVSISLVHQ